MKRGTLALSLSFLSAVASLGASVSYAGAPEVGKAIVGAKRDANPEAVSPPVKGRVVSASLLSDVLLVEILPWPRWAGVSYVVDWASSTPVSGIVPTSVPRTSGSTESLLTLEANLIVLSDYNNALTYAQLKNAGVRLHVVHAVGTFEELFLQITELGRVVSRPTEAGRLVTRLREELKSIQSARPALGTRALKALLMQGMYSYGAETLQGDCVRRAGLENVLAEDGFGPNPQLNVEKILQLAPEVVFVAADIESPRRASLTELPPGVPWEGVPAYRDDAVFLVPGSWMASISHHAIKACGAYALLAGRLK